jgi:SulP family sulfate permease
VGIIAFGYSWSTLRKDALAGLTVAAISLPQAMAYALIAGVEPRFGLYSAIVVTAVASVFGSSSHLINGPTNAISLVVFSALAFVEPERRPEAMFVLAIMVGGIQCLIAILRLGDLTRYISESVVIGFMAGAGMLIALRQVGKLLGLKDQGTGHQHVLYRLWLTLTEGGAINGRALLLGVVTVVLVIALRSLARKYRLPRADMLLALMLVSAAGATLGWTTAGPDTKLLVDVVGAIPPDLPVLHVPEIDSSWLGQMSGSALAIAFLGLVEALAISKSIAHRTRQSLNYNRQCLAEGLANAAGGFFQCLPGSGSFTRSAINFQAGAATRLSGVFAAAAVAVVVLLLAPWARYIPESALAGILVVTAAGLVDWPRLFYAMRASRYDAGLVLVTFVAVFVSVEFAILIGVGLSILLFVPRAARLQVTELILNSDRVVRERQPSDPGCTAMAIFDLEGELFFGAAPDLDRCFEDLSKRAKAGARVVVLRIKRTRNPDMVCLERLQHFMQTMQTNGVTVLLCGVREDFARAMANLDFAKWLPADCVFPEDRLAPGSSTLAAVRRGYELIGSNLCSTCPRRGKVEAEETALYYMI